MQLAFAPNGAELAAHTLEGWCQLPPDDDIVSCDTRNMYNECRRAPSFEALREHDPECVPVYSMLYAHEAEIYLDRTRSGAMVQLTMDQVCARAARLGVEGLEETEDPDAELDSIPILFLFYSYSVSSILFLYTTTPCARTCSSARPLCTSMTSDAPTVGDQ